MFLLLSAQSDATSAPSHTQPKRGKKANSTRKTIVEGSWAAPADTGRRRAPSGAPSRDQVTDLFNLKKSHLETPRTSLDTVPLRTVGFAGQPVSV